MKCTLTDWFYHSVLLLEFQWKYIELYMYDETFGSATLCQTYWTNVWWLFGLMYFRVLVISYSRYLVILPRILVISPRISLAREREYAAR